MSKGIYLTLTDAMYHKLQAELKLYSYMNVQEVILDALREKYFRRSQNVSGAKRGRPKEVTSVDRLSILGRKKIFSD